MKDPICGMEVTPESAVGKMGWQGETYFFCSQHCLEKFRADPAAYLGHLAPGALSQETQEKSGVPGKEYTCPMHPEVVQGEPGSCPICGMALEPRIVTGEEEVSPELVEMSRRFWISLALTIPVFFLAMSGMIPGRPVQRVFSARLLTLIQLAFATPVVLWGGWPFFQRGWRSVANRSLLDELSIDSGVLTDQAENLRRDGQTVMYIVVDNRPAGLIGVTDPIKGSTFEAIKLLNQDGVRIVMVTGDSRTTAEAVARKLGIDEVMAEVLPEQKGEMVKRLQAEGRVVAMAGDGINDAPALAQAHVGIAMGTGTDVAMESAGVTLVKGDLRGIARARRLSRAAMHNIRQNLFFAFIYNTLGIPIAAGVLYPLFGVLLSPMIAAAAMTFSSVSVIGNALRLRKVVL